MDQLINIIGSMYLSGYVILIVMFMNFQMTTSVSQYLQDTNSERNAISIAQIMEYDIYKAGFKISGNKILQADSTTMQFAADLDNNGTADTVLYYTNSVTAFRGTVNPNDFALFRRVNSGSANTVAYVTSARFTYSDSTGTTLSYGTVANQAGRNRIKYITAYIRCETADSLTTAYSPVEWRKKIRPKNI